MHVHVCVSVCSSSCVQSYEGNIDNQLRLGDTKFLPVGAVVADGLETAGVVGVLDVVEVDGCLDVGWEDTGVDLDVVDSGSKSGPSVEIMDGSRVMSPDPDPDDPSIVVTARPGAEVTALVLTGWGRSIGSSIRIFSLQLSLSEQQIYSSVAVLKEPLLQTGSI